MISEGFVINARILAKDRRNAAVHEAGHIVIAEHQGIYPEGAYITPNLDGNKFDTFWTGRVFYLGIEEIPKRKRMMIACAGALSEDIWRNPYDDFDYKLYEDWTEVMSPTDWELSGCNPDSSGLDDPKSPFFKAAHETFKLLKGPLHNNVIKECRWLINNSRKDIEASLIRNFPSK
jgi:hypothetical protein